VHDSGLECEHDRLDPIAKPELAEDVGDMSLGGVLRHEQLRSDLRIRKTAGEETKDLHLSGSEGGEGWRRLPWRIFNESLDETPGDRRRK
jgi:hypothetical protein